MRCSVADCMNPVHGHGWCAKHYRRWCAHGDPLGGLAFRHRGHRCEVEGCDELVDSHGFCQFHRRRWQRFGDPLAGGAPRPQSGPRTARPSYRTVHGRLVQWRGPADHCEQCGSFQELGVTYEWALRHEAEETFLDPRGLTYSASLDDYFQLCCKCHRRYDAAHRADGYVAAPAKVQEATA